MAKIKHIPLQPPRESVPLEGIFLALWRSFAEGRPDEWRGIFRDCTFAPRQRAASVASSFMVYMGCNSGLSFTARAERLASQREFAYSEAAYLAAWTEENVRHRSTNNGLRCVEYMLAREHPIHTKGLMTGRVNWKAVPNITMEDMDVIECMVRWWAGNTAIVMREHAAALHLAEKANYMLESRPT